jgi:hypothetical protein
LKCTNTLNSPLFFIYTQQFFATSEMNQTNVTSAPKTPKRERKLTMPKTPRKRKLGVYDSPPIRNRTLSADDFKTPLRKKRPLVTPDAPIKKHSKKAHMLNSIRDLTAMINDLSSAHEKVETIVIKNSEIVHETWTISPIDPSVQSVQLYNYQTVNLL